MSKHKKADLLDPVDPYLATAGIFRLHLFRNIWCRYESRIIYGVSKIYIQVKYDNSGFIMFFKKEGSEDRLHSFDFSSAPCTCIAEAIRYLGIKEIYLNGKLLTKIIIKPKTVLEALNNYAEG